jgi:hypothetical protein
VAVVMRKSPELPDNENDVVRRNNELADALSCDDVFRRLADLARIPKIEVARRYFTDGLLNLMFDAWERDDARLATSRLGTINPKLSKAVDVLRSAKQALADLDKKDREGLWWPIVEIERGIDRFLELMIGETEQVRPRTYARGRRSGTIKNPTFRIFLRGLVKCAVASGGRLTLEKNIRKGTLIDAIDMLAPYLPDGFVPESLPFSTLQRIKSSLTQRR